MCFVTLYTLCNTFYILHFSLNSSINKYLHTFIYCESYNNGNKNKQMGPNQTYRLLHSKGNDKTKRQPTDCKLRN